jgi:hypothetical protein
MWRLPATSFVDCPPQTHWNGVAIRNYLPYQRDETIEREPKFGFVSITGKVILTKTTTQKVTLMFEKK